MKSKQQNLSLAEVRRRPRLRLEKPRSGLRGEEQAERERKLQIWERKIQNRTTKKEA